MKDRTRQVLLFGMPTDIDFELLQKQKEWLVNQPKNEHVEGLLGFLDWFQDTAEFALGKEGPAVVFGDKPEVVVFRKWRAAPRNVIALFPELETGRTTGGSTLCRSVEFAFGPPELAVGNVQYALTIHQTKAATPEEYAGLKLALEQRDYVLDVRKHKPTQYRNYKHKKVV